PLDERADVESRSARHDGRAAARFDLPERGTRLLPEPARAVDLGGVEKGDEMMRGAGAILERGGFGSDLQTAVDLAGVRADDLGPEPIGERERDEALPRGGRAHQHDGLPLVRRPPATGAARLTGGQNADPTPPSRHGRRWDVRGDRHAGGWWRTADRRARAARSGSGPG